MQIIPSLLFGISASLDALLVGISYGLRKVKFSLLHSAFISLVALLGTCFSIGVGGFLIPLVPSWVSRFGGSSVLVLLGIGYLFQFMWKLLHKYPEDTKISRLTPSGIFFLSIALSANNMGIGLSASLAGIPLLPAALATFLCSFAFLTAGNRLGKCRFLQIAGGLSDPLSGILLILLGFYEAFLP